MWKSHTLLNIFEIYMSAYKSGLLSDRKDCGSLTNAGLRVYLDEKLERSRNIFEGQCEEYHCLCAEDGAETSPIKAFTRDLQTRHGTE